MGSGPVTDEFQKSVSRALIDPRVSNLLFPQLNQLAQQQQQFGQQAQQIGGQIQTEVASQGPDEVTRALLSQANQALGQQTGAQQQQIAQAFRGQPGVSQVLQQQAAMRSRLQANPLLFSAMQQQGQREAQQMQMRNAALLQQLGAYQAPIQSAVQAFQPLLGAAQATGGQEQFAIKGEQRRSALNQQYGQASSGFDSNRG